MRTTLKEVETTTENLSWFFLCTKRNLLMEFASAK